MLSIPRIKRLLSAQLLGISSVICTMKSALGHFFASFFMVILMISGLPQTAQAGMEPWGLGFQPAATSVMEGITDFHNLLLIECKDYYD